MKSSSGRAGRQTVRRFTMHQFVQAGLAVSNPDKPERPTNSPAYCYQIEPKALETLQTYGTKEWGYALRSYLASVEKFLAVLKLRWAQWFAMVFVQFATARRFGEVSALQWEDVDEERGVIKIRRAQWHGIVSTTKTNQVVRVPLTEELRQVLRDWRQEMIRSQHRHLQSGWIFPSQAGTPHQNSSCMRKAFIDVLKEIDVGRRFTSHGLRRTANNLLRQVATSEVTRAITGHMTEAMTEHYSHVAVGEKKTAVEGMLRLVQVGNATLEKAPNRHSDRHSGSETGTNGKAG
jgi:integrase